MAALRCAALVTVGCSAVRTTAISPPPSSASASAAVPLPQADGGAEQHSGYGMRWMSGGAARQGGRALALARLGVRSTHALAPLVAPLLEP